MNRLWEMLRVRLLVGTVISVRSCGLGAQSTWAQLTCILKVLRDLRMMYGCGW